MASPPEKPGLPSDFADEPLDPLTEEALHWLAFLHSGKESADDWATYQDWKAASPERMAAAEEAETLWVQLGFAFGPDRKPGSGRLPIVIAATLACAGLAFASGLFGEPRYYFADYRTDTGERRSVAMADGTQVDMDSGTSFDVGSGGRNISLYTGQIFVAVKGGPARPFVVNVDNGSVRTLGTKFAVRRDPAGVTAFVTEHAVRVAYPSDRPGPTVDVAAGQVVEFGPRSGLGQARPADISALTAWQRGELVFNQTALGKVTSELERYRRGRIFVVGDDVSKLSFTGVFDIADPDSVLDSMELALPVSILRMPGLVVIRADAARTRAPAR